MTDPVTSSGRCKCTQCFVARQPLSWPRPIRHHHVYTQSYTRYTRATLLGLDLNCICKYACRKSGQLFNFTWTCSNVHGYLKWRHGNVKNTHPTLYEHSNIRTCLVSYNFLSLNSCTHCFRHKLHKEKTVLDYQTSDTYVKLPHTLATVQQRFTIITTHHKF